MWAGILCLARLTFDLPPSAIWFRYKLSGPKGKAMSPRNRQLVLWLALSALAIGCQRVKTPTVVELPPLDTPVALPVEKEIADYEEYTGKIMAVDRVNIMARVDGYLSEILFKPGEMVKKGDLLFVIDRRPYQM